jgi:uncharacterized protein YbjT (DUF2867 family)
MVDEKLIEEIVRRVVARLLAEGQLQVAGEPAPGPAPAPRAQGVTHTGRVLTEWEILQAHRSGKGFISLSCKTIVTPLARDRARDLSVELVYTDGPPRA